GFNFYSIVAQSHDGALIKERLPHEAYLQIVAATNFKQRVRKMLEYYHADRLNYLTTGTPNRLEYDQGFFVKLGDGAADIKLIAHLYKSQVSSWPNISACPKKSGSGLRPRIPIPCIKARTNFTSPCLMSRWTFACTARTTESRPRPWPN